MITRLLTLATVTALAAVALTGCVPLGPMSTASPEIGDVTAVVLDTDGDLEIREGEPSLTIHAPANILDRLTAEVRDGVLELGRLPGTFVGGFADVRYELTVPSLDSIEVSGSGDVTSTVSSGHLTIEITGSGDVTVDGIDADAVELTIDGSGDVELTGVADALTIEIAGSGEIDAEDLEVSTASVDIGGSGSASVNVTSTLTVDISGSGSVTHTGGAEVDAEISGSGEVEADD
jgi:hypothetical protein